MNDIINLYNNSIDYNVKIINQIMISDIGLNDPYLMEFVKKILNVFYYKIIKLI